jgi:hypothetical protein
VLLSRILVKARKQQISRLLLLLLLLLFTARSLWEVLLLGV